MLLVKTFLLIVLLSVFARGEIVDREVRIAEAQNFLERCRFVIVIEPQARDLKGLTSIKGGKPDRFVEAFANTLIKRVPKLKATDNELGGFIIYQLADDEETTIRTSAVDVNGSVRGQSFDLDLLKNAGRAKRKNKK